MQSPIEIFQEWYRDAQQKKVPTPEGMTLATSSRKGVPSARIVLLKGVSEKGFEFHTNYRSHKGQELISNPYAALVFHWDALQRQVRITGKVQKLPRAESDRYFASRDRGSQIGAWASQQSQPIRNRDELVAQVAEVEKRFAGQAVPRPSHWGGFLVVPNEIEFWQGAPHRLHDRQVYTRTRGKSWKLVKLSP